MLDYVILEVGLGGRLDATNIIDSDLSIITSIGIDHTEFLGSTIDSIALEKAGVMRPFKLSIYAGRNPPSSLFAYANKIKSRLQFAGQEVRILTLHVVSLLIKIKKIIDKYYRAFFLLYFEYKNRGIIIINF